MSSDQMPAPGKIKLIKFPPPGQEKTSNTRGMPGGGMLKLRFDWYIMGQPSLFNGRVHYILTLVYKSLNVLAPEYITDMFSLKTHSINLRASGTNSLLIPRFNTTTYGMHSLSYYGSKLWNSLPNTTRSLPTVAAFKSIIRNLVFDTDCCPFCK